MTSSTTKNYINNVQKEVSNIDIEENSIEKKEDKKDESWRKWEWLY